MEERKKLPVPKRQPEFIDSKTYIKGALPGEKGSRNPLYVCKTKQDVYNELKAERSISGGFFVVKESHGPRREPLVDKKTGLQKRGKDGELLWKGGKMADFPHVINLWSNEAQDFCFKMSDNPKLICNDCYFVTRDAILRYDVPWRAWANAQAVRTCDAPPMVINPNPHDPKQNFCRINAEGEVGHVDDCLWLLRTVIHNPWITFAWWTKQPQLVQAAMKSLKIGKPENLILIKLSFQMHKPDPLPAGFDRVFTVYTEEEIDKRVAADAGKPRKKAFTAVCRGKQCFYCMICYNKSNLIRPTDKDEDKNTIDYSIINEKLK